MTTDWPHDSKAHDLEAQGRDVLKRESAVASMDYEQAGRRVHYDRAHVTARGHIAHALRKLDMHRDGTQSMDSRDVCGHLAAALELLR